MSQKYQMELLFIIIYSSAFLISGLNSQDISFELDTTSKQIKACETIGGPNAGLPCKFPFKFRGDTKKGCILDSDPENKYWCSTKVDKEGNHIPNEGNWAHCSDGCPKDDSVSSGKSGAEEETPELEGSTCTSKSGELGSCSLPSSCVGVDISFLENNACDLLNGNKGVCCPEITTNNIFSIVDSNQIEVVIPDISISEADSFLRFGASAPPADEVFSPNRQAASPPRQATPPRLGPGVPVFQDDIDDDDEGPADFLLRFNSPRKDISVVDSDAELLVQTTKRIQIANNLTDIQAGVGLRNSFNSDTSTEIDSRCPWTPAPRCNPSLRYRSFDGTCNNLKEPNFGRTGTPYQRILLPEYAQGSLDLPRKRSDNTRELPSAREISNALAGGTSNSDNDNTVLVMQMGQFIDHDITHTPNHGKQCCDRGGKFPASFDPKKCFPIRMFDNDNFWRGKKTCMSLARSLSSPSLKCGLQSREQLNQITHWLDGSNIYGSTNEEAQYLRSSKGQLKISRQRGTRWGNLPSCAAEKTGKVTGCDVCGGRKADCFFAGDFRVNEQLNLITIHTLFMREHNRIAKELGRLNPRWTDEKIYQEARKINTAEYQHIVFKEWLPIIIGNTFMRSYGLFPLTSGFSRDYADNFDPRINNEFATAAFRFGHSMIPKTFTSSSKGRSERTLNLREIFFKPKVMSTPGFLDGMLRGMTEQGSAKWDSNFIADIRDHLFESRPGSGGLDLVAVNIQRGRDHGIPGYNKYREICVGRAAKSWEDLGSSMGADTIKNLRRIYNSVDDVDLYVGGFLEAAHEDSILGPVFKCIIGDQFARLKKGDRFFYDLNVDPKLAFSPTQLQQIRKTTMARLICDNTDGIDSVQPFAFKMEVGVSNRLTACNSQAIPTINLDVFRESTFGR